MKEDNDCPSIETLSFGSDIDIKCNNSYLIFNEINSKGVNWQFADRSSFCQHRERHQGFVHQCGITRIGSKYLKVPVRSLMHGELACIYCQINYRPIAPTIIVSQFDAGISTLYTFNITANGLADDESFEILWAKREGSIEHSMNFWFLQGCIDPTVEIDEHTRHHIVFRVDDATIKRVEFIIRRCHGTCQPYEQCYDDEFSNKFSTNLFYTPDSIEKISCNLDCLNGLVINPTTTTTTINTMIDEKILLSTIELTNRKQTMKFLLLFPILGLLMILMFIIFVFFLISRVRGLRREHVYTKTSRMNLDENKEIIR